MLKYAQKLRGYLLSNKRAIIATLVAMTFFTVCALFFYLGGAARSCSTSLAHGPGDQSAGPVWLNSVVNQPLWGRTLVSNSPYGENLRSPVLITGVLQYTAFWLFAQFFGPVCGFNVYTTLGFVFSAMVVYFFIRSLTKRTDVAIFAGFAATFTPYLQSKTGVHPSYVFFGVFVLALWLLINMWQKPSLKIAVGLGFVISTFFYIDPYFLLLGGTTIGATLFALFGRFLYKTWTLRESPIQLKRHILFARDFFVKLTITGFVVGAIGLLPVLAVRIKYAATINAEVASARSPIKQEAKTYAARIAEYAWPAPQNPYLGKIAERAPYPLQAKQHGSNDAENTLSLSWLLVIMAGLSVGACFVHTYRRSGRLTSRQRLVIGVLCVVSTAAFLISLPPSYKGIIFPSGIITDYIEVWRVFARLQVVVAFSLAIIASMWLATVTQKTIRAQRLGLVTIAILVVGFEYLTFKPLDDKRAWSYTQVNGFYYWLREQKTIDTIAEYPLNEPGQTSVSVTYFTDQYVHKKRLLNAYRAASSQSIVRNSLRDISDPQTSQALAGLGVDLVIIHAEDQAPMPKIDGLQEVDWNRSNNDPDSIYTTGKMWVYKVVAQPDQDRLILAPGSGYSELRINSTYTSAESLFDKAAQLVVLDLNTGSIATKKSAHMATMDVNTTGGEALLTISQKNRVLWSGMVDKNAQKVTFSLDSSAPIELKKLGSNLQNKISINNLNLL